MFGGTPSHKFAQQLVAARLAGVKVHFSAFGSPDGCDRLLDVLEARGETVSGLWQLLCDCTDRCAFERRMDLPLSQPHLAP